MDNLRDGINKIGKSLENKAEDALNRMEDELDNLQDEPVPVYPTGKNISTSIKTQINFQDSRLLSE